ncbi:fused PTS fructose transporter subunit IIA/HPr protein [Vibrio sp. JC009]|uniref:fused PTS fructose transporter subunit IIA/HPr protein n=1 Tax=Vibrio sp. JC009 TaxID=2912314 RepID=UPI0023B153A1|nr:fused PTS fructose transporter subunit IIA/HPr protein [Vibrio sp. JC009]WED23604.1 fused PTS fructose transporter subunit IIA/HPr protein [Vibrio sp. JC009]
MLKLTTTDIKLQQAADEKQSAIRALAADLSEKGLVDAGYVEGMLNREAQNSTFLGNGIAIPHGTTDTRGLVINTGVAVHHFPQGVNWGDGNTVYVAIGIAAKSDEHLGILKQLTKVLSDDGVEEKLKNARSKEEIMALLNGEVQFEADFNESLIQAGFPATDMVQMSAVAAGLIKNTEAATSDFVAQLVAKKPTHLGNGLWLVSGNEGVSRTAMSFVSAENGFEEEGQPVKALIAFAACNGAHKKQLDILTQLVFQQRQKAVAEANATELLSMFSGEDAGEAAADGDANVAVFKIKNPHGLHARPGAMLVAEAKKFECSIKVANLNGEGKQVNAKSLMKVIAMGVKQGHELQFVADGVDAPQALEAIGAAIASGLGEG